MKFLKQMFTSKFALSIMAVVLGLIVSDMIKQGNVVSRIRSAVGL